MDDDDPNGGRWRRRSPVRDNVGMINIALWEGITPPQVEHQEIAPWRQRCQSPPRESLRRARPKLDLGLEEDQYLSHNFGDYFTIAVWSKHMRQEVLPVVASTPMEESSDVALKTSIRGRGFALPPPSKFRSGNLPSGIIPVLQAIPGDADDSACGSDMDENTNTKEDIYYGRYSMDSSPQYDNVERRIPNGVVQRYTPPLQR
ncbi:hypothetical protein NE237_008688 [Protea cynaroides]|uniref:Uncharacterized protein n=1 Tax=Protea cynaroides TaxID=273540 RepID=A0A9Q0QZL0_9MAGN|nr:hypothetical protein NE237_008688 [Protea cynaroides]